MLPSVGSAAIAIEPGWTTRSTSFRFPSCSTVSIRTRKTRPEYISLVPMTLGAFGIVLTCIPIDGERGARLVLRANVRRQTSIGQELIWLLIFFAILAAVASIALRLAAAQHFDDRIAVTIAGLFSGLLIIALRARFIGRNARRS